MENFGLVAFREVTMLHDEKVSAPLNKQRVATIIGKIIAISTSKIKKKKKLKKIIFIC